MSENNGHDNDNRPPLNPPLPMPPTAYLYGMPFVLEKVRIDQLETWCEERGLVRVASAWLGEPGWRQRPGGGMRWGGCGWASVYWPREWVEQEDGDG